MPISRNNGFIALCFLISLISCKKGIDTSGPLPVSDNSFPIPASSPVTGRITGIVVDENNAPVQQAEVKLNGSIYHTDSKGFFHISNSQLDKYISTITVTKDGYFKAYRSFSASPSRNYISIKLIPKSLNGSIEASAGGNISLANGTQISLPANGFIIKNSGAGYTGTVKVYTSYIDPTTSDFGASVPGSMMARDGNRMYVLQSAGMIAVDLESTAGEALQLASGKTASVKLPIPSALISKAPQEIDTWSLNEQGIWIKEGTAIKNGNYYQFQVTHFSFWNCDVPAQAIFLTLNVHNQNGDPLSNTLVQLSIPNNNTWWATTYGITDSAGVVSGLVPANLGLTMAVNPNFYSCSTPVFTQAIGPFAHDTTINVTVNLNAAQQLTINGTFNDCNGQPVDSGMVSILLGNYNYYYAAVVNGSYSITVPYCFTISTATVWLYNQSTTASAGPVTVPVSGNSITVPAQTACTVAPAAVYNNIACTPVGSYIAGLPVNAANYIAAIINVVTPGPYNITTNTSNGIVFTGTGNLTNVGRDTIFLSAAGTPVNSGIFTFAVPGAAQNCGVTVNVGNNNPAAVYTINCNSIAANGNYVVNFPLNITNFVTASVIVTTVGAWAVSSGSSVNGIYFQDSGVFNNTGVQTVQIRAYGNPAAAATNTYLLQPNNGQPVCSFNLTSTLTGSANYTFEGAPGTCSGVTVAGNYQTGVPLIGPNTAAIQINILTVGAYSIMTNSVNGITFMGSGMANTTGLRTVLLTASGTPQAAGNFTFAANGGSSPGCNFIVSVN